MNQCEALHFSTKYTVLETEVILRFQGAFSTKECTYSIHVHIHTLILTSSDSHFDLRGHLSGESHSDLPSPIILIESVGVVRKSYLHTCYRIVQLHIEIALL